MKSAVLHSHEICCAGAGMGCSAGIISVDLASHLLKASPSKDAYALVLSTEGQTTNW